MGPLLLLDRGRAAAPQQSPAAKDAPADPNERWWVCRACGMAIAPCAAELAVDGSHVHERVNPVGFRFRFGCFGAAPGALSLGVPTGEASWFAGYRWALAACCGCSQHLGWQFQGEATAFFGLILERLREERLPRA